MDARDPDRHQGGAQGAPLSGVRLEPLARRHLPAARAWFNHPALARLLGRNRVIAEDEHESWFCGLSQSPVPYFAIIRSTDGAHIGNVWLADVTAHSAEVRIVIGTPGGDNAGLGPVAIAAIARYAFHTLSLRRLTARVFAINPRAHRAFEKAGFVLERTLPAAERVDGRDVDVYVLACDSPGPAARS